MITLPPPPPPRQSSFLIASPKRGGCLAALGLAIALTTGAAAPAQGVVMLNDFEVNVHYLFINGQVSSNNPPVPTTYRWKLMADLKIKGATPRGTGVLNDDRVATVIRAYDANGNIVWASYVGLRGQTQRWRFYPLSPYKSIFDLTDGDIQFPITVDVVVFFPAFLGGGDPNPPFPPPDGYQEMVLYRRILQDPRNGNFIRATGIARGNVVNGEVNPKGEVEFRIGHTQFPFHDIKLHSKMVHSGRNLLSIHENKRPDDLSVGFIKFEDDLQIPITDFDLFGIPWVPLFEAPTVSWADFQNGQQIFAGPHIGYIIYYP